MEGEPEVIDSHEVHKAVIKEEVTAVQGNGFNWKIKDRTMIDDSSETKRKRLPALEEMIKIAEV